MSLKARLTLIYGALLLVVFVALGFGAEIVMQGRFADETKSRLTSAANYVLNNYWITPIDAYAVYHLPAQSPFTGIYVEVVNSDGKAVVGSPDSSGNNPPVDMRAVRRVLRSGVTTIEHQSMAGNHLEIYYTPMARIRLAKHARPQAVLMVATSDGVTDHALAIFNAALFGGEALIWLLAVLVTWLVAGSALRPIKAMTERAAAIAATSDFSGRVPVDTQAAELQRLAVTFNAMLESLQRAYANQQRFLADASHELRTPLTIVQGNLHYLEEAVDAPRGEQVDALHAARIEADRMGGLVRDLLALSQADAGYEIYRSSVELDRIVVDGVRRIQARDRSVRDSSGVQVRVDRLDEVVVEGDHERLLQLVLILLDNAVKYSPQGGVVAVELIRQSGEWVLLRVCDTGLGIAPEDRARVFGRFYRSKDVRAVSEGSGLGLPIAAWIVEAHKGTIEFHPNHPQGTVFEVRLPFVLTVSALGEGAVAEEARLAIGVS